MRVGGAALFAFVVLVVAGGAVANPVSCAVESGSATKPLVSTTGEARNIFLAVARVRDQRHRYSGRTVVVEDHGDSWSVFVWTPPIVKTDPRQPEVETVGTTEGGGTLELKIDKCNGAMSASFSR
jgi:hypothetical protein